MRARAGFAFGQETHLNKLKLCKRMWQKIIARPFHNADNLLYRQLKEYHPIVLASVAQICGILYPQKTSQ